MKELMDSCRGSGEEDENTIHEKPSDLQEEQIIRYQDKIEEQAGTSKLLPETPSELLEEQMIRYQDKIEEQAGTSKLLPISEIHTDDRDPTSFQSAQENLPLEETSEFPNPYEVDIMTHTPPLFYTMTMGDLFWPKKRKLIPNYADMLEFDEKAIQCPRSLITDPRKLLTYLLQDAYTEVGKVRRIVRWICENIEYDVEGRYNGKAEVHFEGVLKTRKAGCRGYTTVLQALCHQAGIGCEIVSGQTKNEHEPPAEKIRTVPVIDHQWNIVFISEEWYFIDPTWCAGSVEGNTFKKKWNEWWFLTDPEAFAFSHLPISKRGQILTNVQMVKVPFLNSEQWDTMIDRYPGTYHFGMEPRTRQIQRFECKHREVILRYTCNKKIKHFASITLENTYANDEIVHTELPNNWTMVYECDAVVTAHFRFPQKGMYILTLKSKYNIGPNVHSITCFHFRVQFQGPNSVPFMESIYHLWGEQPEFVQAGFSVLSPKCPHVQTRNGNIVVKLMAPTRGLYPNMHRLIKSDIGIVRVKNVNFNGYVYGERINDRNRLVVYHVQLPEEGEYRFEIYVKYMNQKDSGFKIGVSFFFKYVASSYKCTFYPHPEDINLGLAGPNEHFYKMGLSTNAKSTTFIFNNEGVVKLHIKMFVKSFLRAELKSCIDQHCNRFLSTKEEDEILTITVKEPAAPGYYWITLYASSSQNGTYTNVGSFCLRYKVRI